MENGKWKVMKNKEYSIAMNWSYVGLSVVVFSILTVLVLYLPNMREIDSTILRSVRLALSQFPGYIPVFVSEFGRANNFLWPQITAACVLVSHRMYLRAFMLVLIANCALFVKELIKDYICRQRPEGCDISSFSFPSGHCTFTMCFYGIIIYLVHVHIKSDFWRNFLIILFGAWIFMMGVSRMWLGAHFPTDVLAGMFLGFFFAQLFIILDKSISR